MQKFTKEMVDIRVSAKTGFDVAMENNLFVILNTEQTPALIHEGMAREIVSKVQNMRKTKGLEITDRITLYYNGTQTINEVMTLFKEYIMDETLATEITIKDSLSEKFDINGEEVYLDLEKNA